MKSWLFASLCLLPLAAAAAPAFHIEPGPQVLAGEPVTIRLSGLPPGTELRLRAERWYAPLSRQPQAPQLLRSEVLLRADAQGRIDLGSSAPLSGSWRGADPHGPFWSMSPVPDVPRAAAGSVNTAELRFEIAAGEIRLAEAKLELLEALPDVRVSAAEGLPGAVFASLPGAHKRPALILLGGSEGGSLITLAAPAFASHGFAVLALPLFSPPDAQGRREIPELPAGWVEMPIEGLDRARDWLAARPEVDATRIALHGTSMGGLLALLAGTHLPWVQAVVANVPSDVVWDGWGPGVPDGQRSQFSLRGQALPFVPLIGYDEELRKRDQQQPVLIRRPHERGRAAAPQRAAAARVPVERIRVPLMVIGGYDDQMWPSGAMAQAIAERRWEAGLATEALLFQDAGHRLYGHGYEPTSLINRGLRKIGGTPESTARAQAIVWPRTLDFLKRSLGPMPRH